MGKEHGAPDILLFQGLTVADTAIGDKIIELLRGRYGEILEVSDYLRFSDHTAYYEKEMGSPLYKRYMSFRRRLSLENFQLLKKESNKLEADYTVNGKRRINVDPGAISLFNFSLLSTKGFSHRIYLADGIYSELTLTVHQGRFQPLPWTYADYLQPEVLQLLENSRLYLKKQIADKQS